MELSYPQGSRCIHAGIEREALARGSCLAEKNVGERVHGVYIRLTNVIILPSLLCSSVDFIRYLVFGTLLPISTRE